MKSVEILSTNCKDVGGNDKEIIESLKMYFEGKGSFDLKNMNDLEPEVLLPALKAINTYFTEDMYVLRNYEVLMLSKNNPLIDQIKFAQMLKEHGFKYDRKKFSVYLSRGVMPPHDVQIGSKKYWYESTAKEFIKNHSGRLLYDI